MGERCQYMCVPCRGVGRREAHGWDQGACALSKRLVKCRLKVPAWARKNRCHSRQMTFRRATGRNVARKMSIGRENYEISIIPLLSDSSGFSRGTAAKPVG